MCNLEQKIALDYNRTTTDVIQYHEANGGLIANYNNRMWYLIFTFVYCIIKNK